MSGSLRSFGVLLSTSICLIHLTDEKAGIQTSWAHRSLEPFRTAETISSTDHVGLGATRMMLEKHVGVLCELPPLKVCWGERCAQGRGAWSPVAGKVPRLISAIGPGTSEDMTHARCLCQRPPGGRQGGRERCVVRDAGKHLHFGFLVEKVQQTRSGHQAH